MRGKSQTKDRFVGVRFDRQQVHRLVLLSALAGAPGNLSAGLRWAVDNVPTANSGQQLSESRPERAMAAT